MEFEFHSASYQTLLEAVQAIRIALGHLINFMKVNSLMYLIYACLIFILAVEG